MIEQLKKAAAKLNVTQLVNAIEQIGGGTVGQDAGMVRAALIELYADREGVEAADALMDKIGL